VVGTPLYLSPEILAGEPPSIAQDLWALHVVLWESLVGRHPMAGMPHETALDRIRSGEMPSARAARPDCPKALEDLLHRGLDLRRDARPATATELGKDLAAVLASLS
jgi:serine/threonine-protein kinase